MTKVSICIPAYNQVKYLRQTIDSVLNQTYDDYEIIITDDSPTNIVFDLIQEYGENNKIKYYKNELALGSPENWNEAIRLSKGEYIKIVHHDDYFTFTHSLKSFVDLLDNSPNALLGFSASVVDFVYENKTWIHRPLIDDLESLKKNSYNLFFKNFIGAPSATIFRRDSGIFFDKNLKWVVDFEFYSRILKDSAVFEYDSRELITTVGIGSNISNECINNKNVEVKEYIYFYNKIPPIKIEYKKTFLFFKKLFLKYQISSVDDIKGCGYSDKIPSLIYVLLFRNKILKEIKKILR